MKKSICWQQELLKGLLKEIRFTIPTIVHHPPAMSTIRQHRIPTFTAMFASFANFITPFHKLMFAYSN